MALAEATAKTVTVACPHLGCGTRIDLPILASLHAPRKDLSPYIRVRVDHTQMDAHIESEHGPAVIA